MQLPALAIQQPDIGASIARAAAIKDSQVRNRLLQRQLDTQDAATQARVNLLSPQQTSPEQALAAGGGPTPQAEAMIGQPRAGGQIDINSPEARNAIALDPSLIDTIGKMNEQQKAAAKERVEELALALDWTMQQPNPEQAWPRVRESLIKEGMPEAELPPQWDAGKAQRGIAEAMGLKAVLEQRKPTSTMQNVGAMGLEQGTPEYQAAMREAVMKPASQTTINNMGSIPQGFQLNYNDQGRPESMSPIPGSPAAKEEEELERKQEGRTAQTRRAGTTVVQDLGRALQLLPEIAQGDGVAGANLRAVRVNIKGTVEYRINDFKESALSNVGLDTLQQMRENSPTGGALGQVPIQQQQRLEQVLGSLDLSQAPADIEANIQRIMNIYTDIMYGSSKERARAVREGKMTPEENAEIEARYYELPFDDMGRPVESGGGTPDIDALLKKYGQ